MDSRIEPIQCVISRPDPDAPAVYHPRLTAPARAGAAAARAAAPPGTAARARSAIRGSCARAPTRSATRAGRPGRAAARKAARRRPRPRSRKRTCRPGSGLLPHHRRIEGEEVDRHRQHHPRARARDRHAECHQHAAQVEGIARVGVGPAGREPLRLLDVPGGPEANRLADTASGRPSSSHRGVGRASTSTSEPDRQPAGDPIARGHRRAVRRRASASRRSTAAQHLVDGDARPSRRRGSRSRGCSTARTSASARTTPSVGANGPLRAGSVGPKSATTGVPTAQARCSGPGVGRHHQPRAARQLDVFAAASSGSERRAAPSEAATTRSARPSSPGAPGHERPEAALAQISRASAPKRSARPQLALPAAARVQHHESRPRPSAAQALVDALTASAERRQRELAQADGVDAERPQQREVLVDHVRRGRSRACAPSAARPSRARGERRARSRRRGERRTARAQPPTSTGPGSRAPRRSARRAARRSAAERTARAKAVRAGA